MTDKEIIKALECCKSFDDLRACYKCPVLENGDCSNGKVYISNFILDNTLDLIIRQEAEIERLQKEVDRLSLCVLYHEGQIADAKAEAIKEFAEKLKENAIDVDVSYGYGKEHYTEAVAVIEIDNLVKEMTKQTTFEKVEHNSLCETETYKGGE